ncbi:1-(5-phosphoribosyl)-5-[(5-phosphoribosylamino)methylideneamino] imidazole-4-carboxamide isomerase [Humidesulfovibrio mexicanus]|uniref:1-(5-phosphoribosyl)-5-[(5-phosphoribosylamino)methylideneamino] imidazole-4-carboxamide isomerase n=1 Tax=Humidesulfovibrio mexicanus TaxID=147047 RepID=A0A239AZ10_9BACT|nr:1-(5-phosphoribosyl)-5-[(5-phosphoribosylamino)methylideneamino]imidazole-4-carboxamide isomerase [Humidesulfovibrio mexicanus]SNS00945.1 1-(5-phosphoribosyl)-5-[(5-phosphoribosylamino)methylideneamino] imidazole-4-carboxamide isomerase [Humidesulfovibrio mexicanus]
MILFPAVDIKDGRCVRLEQGRADAVTVFGEDPAESALSWVRQGAQWLHVVDLDGAFSGLPRNFELVKRICAEAGVPVQLGGGIRDLDTAKAYVEAGVTRLIIGTIALEQPELFASMCAQLPGKVGVSLDAVGGQLKSRGWVADAGMTVMDVLPRIEAAGAAFIIYTDIARDGMQSGVNLPALAALCEATKLPVVAAGGVTNLDDLKNLAPLASKGLQGAISGRAIYAGTLDFAQGLAFTKGLQQAA